MIVETTGDPGTILDAIRRVADLGIVVLVGETLSRRFRIKPLSGRPCAGLTLLGVSPPLQSADAAFGKTRVDTESSNGVVHLWCACRWVIRFPLTRRGLRFPADHNPSQLGGTPPAEPALQEACICVP